MPHIECGKAIYWMVCMRFLMIGYLSDVLFRYYFINQQPWIRLFCCYTWYKRNFPIISPFKTTFLPQIQREKNDLQMCWMALRVMRYPLKRFLWQYIINVYQYLPLVWCQRRSKINFPVVSPFKTSFLPQIQREKVTYKCVEWHWE